MNAEPPIGPMTLTEINKTCDALGLQATQCKVCSEWTLYEPLTHSRFCPCNIKASGKKEAPKTCGRLACMVAEGEMKGVGLS